MIKPVFRMMPVIKCAGGKTQLLDVIRSNMPVNYNRYFEPFIGGGAVLLDIMPNCAVIGDTNEQLINVYTQIRDNPLDVIRNINALDNVVCDKAYYYYIRDQYNNKIVSKELDAECAAFMIWINKHCFNGLYRVNKDGLFNVPYNNKKKGVSVDEDNLMAISSYLRHNCISIRCCDFERCCKDVGANDFVYLDSPYIPVSDTAKFTDYTKDGFTLKDHKRLFVLFRYLDKIGAKVMLSNNDVPLVYKLYNGYNIKAFNAKRMINRDVSKRMGREVLVTNY